MAIHTVTCSNCGLTEDTWVQMEEALQKQWPDCSRCSQPTAKVYTVPADHSANTFRPRWSEQLSTGADPVYIATKAEYERRKAKLGLQEYELGMRQDKDRRKAEEQSKIVDSTFKAAMAEVDSKRSINLG